MKKIKWILLCLVLPGAVFAQKKYKNAIVVTSAGDTIHALLNDKEWRVNPSEVQLKTSTDGTGKIYTASQLKSISIENGERYFVATVKVDNTPSEFQTSYVDPQLIKTDEATVFLLQEFSNNQLSLYSLQTNKRLHLYIQEKQGTPEELIYRSLTLKRNGSMYETEDKTYVNQLLDLLSSCTSLNEKINNSKYSVSSITTLLKIYDEQCGGKTAIYSNEKNTKGQLNFFVFAGATLTNVKFTGGYSSFGGRQDIVTDKPLKTDPSVSVGLTAVYVLPRMKEKLAFSLSLCYNSFKATVTEYKDYTAPDFYENKTVIINPSLIRANLLARYYVSKQTLSPYLQAGFTTSLVLNHKDELILDDYNAQHRITTTDPYASLEYRKVQIGFALGAGLEYKSFCLDYKFDPTSGFVNSQYVKSKITAHTLMIGFRLNK